MSTTPTRFSIFTPDYLRGLVRVFRYVFPGLGLTELLRAVVEWQRHPLDARLNALFALIFLVGTLGLLSRRRPMLVIRAVVLAVVAVSLCFDALGYSLLPPEITPDNTAYVLTGRHMYLSYVLMLCSWLLFPAPWAGRLAAGICASSLGLSLCAGLLAVSAGRATAEGIVNFALHQALVGGSFCLLMRVFMTVYDRQARLERERAQFRQDALHDALTGLPNRRAFDEALAREVTRARVSGRPLSLVTFDLDHFKRVNDTHGHDVGDRVLLELAALARAQGRTQDLPARWGGEEFAWLLPAAGNAAAREAAERLRRTVAACPFPCGPLTISLGVATLYPDEDAGALFARADAALYRAKRQGRDRVSGEDEEAWDLGLVPALVEA